MWFPIHRLSKKAAVERRVGQVGAGTLPQLGVRGKPPLTGAALGPGVRPAVTHAGRAANPQVRAFVGCTAFYSLKTKLRQIKQNVDNHQTRVVAFSFCESPAHKAS